MNFTLIHGTIATATEAPAPRSGRTVSGYGSKIPMPYMVTLADDPAGTRPRRVYCMVYSNSGSLYVVRRGQDVFLSDTELAAALGRP